MPKVQTQLRGSEPASKIADVIPSRLDDSESNRSSEGNWVEDTPFYLDGVQALLDTLTDEDKEAIHHALQG